MINATVRKKQQWRLGLIILALATIGFVAALIILHHRHQAKLVKAVPNLAGLTTNTDFVAANQKSEILAEQSQMRGLEEEVKALHNQLKAMQENQGKLLHSLKNVKAAQNTNKTDLKATGGLSALTQPVNLERRIPRNKPHDTMMANQNLNALGRVKMRPLPMAAGLISVQSFHYQSNVATPKRSPKNYVPAGTFVRAVILGGADANASVNGQSDTSELIFRVLDRGTIPGGQHSHLKNCTVLASVYGDISSERGIVRLQHISCTFKHQRILDIPVQGWAFYSGKSGIKGVPVMRNGPILMWAGISGLFSGIGQSLAQSQSIQSTSPLGTTTTVPTSRIAASGLYSGAGTALDRLANYYIKRADQYHPIIEIGAGNVATLVFEKGFSLNPDQKVNTRHKALSDTQQTMIPSTLLNEIRHSQMGQRIGVPGNG